MQEKKSAFLEYLAMKLRGSPVRKISRLTKKLQGAGFNISTFELESHHLAGGRIDELADLLVLAKEAGKDLKFDAACAVDLVAKTKGKSGLEFLQRSLDQRSFEFHTFGKDESKIVGTTLNKEMIAASVRFRYHYPITAFDIDESFANVRNRLGALISAEIHASRDYSDFVRKIDGLKAELTRIGSEYVQGLDQLELEATPG